MARRTRFMGEAPLMEKKSFIKTGEQKIASYDWMDMLEGVGYVDFDGLTMVSSTENSTSETRSYFLDKIFKNTTLSELSAAGGNVGSEPEDTIYYRDQITLTSPTVLSPKVMQGTAKLNLFWALERPANGVGLSANGWIKPQILVNDTVVAETYTRRLDLPSSNSYGIITHYSILHITIPKTNLKIGDVIKLKLLVGHLKTSTAKNVGYKVACSPIDATTTNFTKEDTNSTRLNLTLPFKIDL